MANRPNILLFLVDGMQGPTADPAHQCRTPNFSRLAESGIQFSRAYTPTPVCSPTRASLMTGLLAHNHGVLQVEHCVDDDQCVLRSDVPHWAQRLSEAGYRTAYFGKWHIERGGRLEDFGWQVNGSDLTERYRALRREVAEPDDGLLDDYPRRYQTGPAGYRPLLHYAVSTHPAEERPMSVPVRMAEEFLRGADGAEAPWCCCVSFREPNEELVCGRDTFELYDVDDIALPRNLEDDLSGRPAIYRRSQAIWADVTPRQWREARACYYTRITELDRLLGRLLGLLEESGQADDTLILLTGDHGRYVGAHGMDAHNFGAFEELYNIPLIISGPGIADGVRTGARVGLQDLCPTLLELAGLEPFSVPDSASFAPVLREPAAAASDFTTGYAEYHGTRYRLTQRIYWDGDWKFVFNGFDFDELYNLADDPGELHNLAGDPAHAGRVCSMTEGVWRHVRDTGDRTLANAHYYPMRFAAVGPNSA